MFTMEYEIIDFCRNYGIQNYTILDDLSLDVTGSVYLSGFELEKLPVKFNRVIGSFYCYNSHLLTLEGCPNLVTGDFDCVGTGITSLKGGPKEVGGNYKADNCDLTNLEGSPDEIGVDFNVSDNILTSLKGSPKLIKRHFDCGHNKLTSLEFGPEKVNGYYYCNDNNIYNLDGFDGDFRYLEIIQNPIYYIIGDVDKEFVDAFKTFKVIKGKEVNTKRLNYVMDMFGKEINDIESTKEYYKFI